MPFPVAFSLDEIAQLAPKRSAVTLGVFDGVHRGHHRIIEELVTCRADEDIDRVFLMTFDPHPVSVTHSRAMPPVLSTIAERIELFREFDLDGVFVVPFDERTARMDYRDFIQRYFLDAMDMRRLVLGYDCHFGHRRQGSPERVASEGERLGFSVRVVPPVEFDGAVVSSTQIRETLEAGKLDRANDLLGHPYLVRGTVGSGRGKGRNLGFPTANVGVNDPMKLWPPLGVYAVNVIWREQRYGGMMNVGRAPTIKAGETEIEVHIFDFDHTLYGETVSVYCEAWLREERRFPSVDALIAQLTKDRERAREVLGLRQ